MTQTDLITHNVIVRTSDASGVLRPGAVLTATLSGTDTDGTRVITPEIIRVEITEDGAALPLWPNERGVRGTSYRIRSHVNQQVHDLGLIQVQDSGDQFLGDLLLASSVIVPGQTVIAITRTEYDALVAAVTATGDDRARAETAAEQTALDAASTALNAAAAEESASRVDLGALDEAVEQTGEDRAAASIWAGTAAAYAGAAQLSATRALDVVADVTAKADVATTQAGIATTRASEATTGAATATTQAGIATTQAAQAAADRAAIETSLFVYVADDANSVTLALGTGMVVAEGTSPYPNLTLMMEVP